MPGPRCVTGKVGLGAASSELWKLAQQVGGEAGHLLLHAVETFRAANDQMAAGAYSVIKERGLRIPEDIAVVGFDDDLYATSLSPALTTIHHPIAALGEKMAELLVELIEGRAAERIHRLPTSLVVRDSA